MPEPARPRRRGTPRSGGARSGAGARSTATGSGRGRPSATRGAARAPGPRTGGARSPSEAGPSAPGIRSDTPRASGASSVGEEIRLTRAQRMAAATSGVLGVSSTRRAAVLALVVCALALSVAVPLRNYLGQRQELSRLEAEQRRLAVQVDQLAQDRDRLNDPDEIAREARSRLGYVRPGEIPFVVQLPNDPSTARRIVDSSEGQPWFETLWRDVKGVPR
ncbi:MAG TPA: septum formation initiator family protein [Pseudonocardia sp.]|nr:septum formation initiator family protein [Pseudonocardia sp.]